MSKIEEKQSFELDPLDSDVLKVLIEKFNAAKINADKANENLNKAATTFNGYMDRIASANGVDKSGYRPNFITGQFEPIPTIAPIRQITSAPDSSEPPAPFKEPDPIP